VVEVNEVGRGRSKEDVAVVAREDDAGERHVG
jgi:hypothetical protein